MTAHDATARVYHADAVAYRLESALRLTSVETVASFLTIDERLSAALTRLRTAREKSHEPFPIPPRAEDAP